MKRWDQSFVDTLLAAPHYRSFLQTFIFKKAPWSHPRPMSFQDLAKRAGFGSKSFLNDVIAGRKRLTPRSLDKVSSALGLSGAWAEYFKCLVAREETIFQNARQQRPFFQNRVEVLHKKLSAKRTTHKSQGLSPLVEAFLDRDFPDVYAALGSLEDGETLDVIMARTHLPIHRVQTVLNKMLDVELVRWDQKTQRYYAQATTLLSESLRDARVFQQDFFRSLRKVQERFPKQAQTDRALFMSQTFSVRFADLPRLQAELAQSAIQFVEHAETSKGDAIAEICIGFTHGDPQSASADSAMLDA